MLYPYQITFIKVIVQRIQIVIISVNNEVVLKESYLLNRSGSVIVIAVDHAVDIKQSRRLIKNYIDYRNESK